MAALRACIAALLVAALASCAAGPDGEQELLCRRIVPALFDTDNGLKVVASEAGKPGEIFLRFRAPGATREHSLMCRFAGSGLSISKREFVGAVLDGRPLGESTVYLLRERWLQSADSIAETPAAPPVAPWFSASLGARAAYTLQQSVSALPRAGILMLIAGAFALLYGLIGRINLAFGAFAALGGIAAVMAISALDALGVPSLPGGLFLGGGLALAVTALFGLVSARLVLVPLADSPGQQMLVAGAGLMIALEEFLRIAQGANTRWLAPALSAPQVVARADGFDVTVTVMALLVFAAAAAAAAALLIGLGQSRAGRSWRAVADDPHAAALMGIDPGAVIAGTTALACTLCGLAGILVAIHYGGIGFAGGTMLGLTALVAAILGGIGSVGGAMLGGLVIAALEAGWAAVLPIESREIAVFALLIVVLTLRPQGLFGGDRG